MVLGAIQEQISNLGLDYIDLYLIHTPWGYKNGNRRETDYSINAQTDSKGDIIFDDYDHVEIWRELEKAVEPGSKTRNICGNHSRAHF